MIFGVLDKHKRIDQHLFKAALNKAGYSFPNDWTCSEQTSYHKELALFAKCPSHLDPHCAIAQKGHLTVISSARIDNMKEICSDLNISLDRKSKPTDSETILNAYIKWGKNCVHHLLGDWIFAVWDKQQKELFLAKDHFGYSSLFYFNKGSLFIFSSSLKAILAYPGVNKVLNPNAVLQLGKDLKRDCQTYYKGVFQIPSGHCLTKNGAQPKLSCHWLPTTVKPIRYKSDEDYVYHFVALYQEAVRSRIGNGNTGIALSSGLDSGSIATLAAPILAEQGKTLEAFTWKPNIIDDPLIGKRSIPNEVPLVQKLIQHVGNVNLNVVEGKYNNILESIRQSVQILHEPKAINDHYYEILKSAKDKNIQTLFSGILGNFTVSYFGNRPTFFRDLLLNKHPGNLFKEVISWKENQKKSWSFMLSLLVYDTLFSPLIKPIEKKKQLKSRKSIVRSYLNPKAVSEHSPNYLPYTPQMEKLRKSYEGDRMSNLLNIAQSNYLGSQKTLFQHFGMEERCPVIDKRLLEFCLSIPNDQFIRKGQGKYLLKRAMKHKMPDEILFNDKRGRQCSNALSKYKFEAKEIQATFDSFKKSPTVKYWVHLPALYDALTTITNGRAEKGLFSKLRLLKNGLALGMFLQQFDDESA